MPSLLPLSCGNFINRPHCTGRGLLSATKFLSACSHTRLRDSPKPSHDSRAPSSALKLSVDTYTRVRVHRFSVSFYSTSRSRGNHVVVFATTKYFLLFNSRQIPHIPPPSPIATTSSLSIRLPYGPFRISRSQLLVRTNFDSQQYDLSLPSKPEFARFPNKCNS